MTTHYSVLGVRPASTRDEIVRAYRSLIFKNHPDRVGPSGEAKTVELNAAYSVLTDETRRRQYDRTLLPAAAAQPSTDAPQPAGFSPAWMPREPNRTFTTQTSKESPVPTKRDWSEAFPSGSRIRLLWLAVGSLVVAAGLTAAWNATGGLPYAILMLIFGSLTLTKKPKLTGLVGVGIIAAAGFSGAIIQIPMGFAAGISLTVAALGWVPMMLAARSFRQLRRRHREWRLWNVLQEVSEATGVPVFMVISINENSNTALLAEPNTGERRSVQSWAAADVGSWVALNAASLIVHSAPMSAAESFLWVEKRLTKRAKVAAKRATPVSFPM
jgi:hypothetical protein